MNSWPVELISYVFELACTDDGRTARCLAVTSKQISEIARPFLYQSLVLSTTGQLSALLEKVDSTAVHLRPIKHLFLALNHDSHSESSCPGQAPLVIRLLHVAAPTLHSLSFAASCPLTGTSLLSYLFRIPFPHLDELSLAGLYPFSFQAGNFPRLRRLHFAAGNRNPSGLFKLGALDEAFPQLTHLRVSGLSRALVFVNELGQALESARKCPHKSIRNGDDGQTSFFDDMPIRLPSRLQKIYIQTKSSPSPSISRSSSRSSSRTDLFKSAVLTMNASANATDTRQQAMIDRLEELEGEFGGAAPTPVHLVIVSNVHGGPADVVWKLKSDWLERLDGRDGSWGAAHSLIIRYLGATFRLKSQCYILYDNDGVRK